MRAGETAHGLHTAAQESPSTIEVSSNSNLLPPLLNDQRQTGTNATTTSNDGGQRGTEEDTETPIGTGSPDRTAHGLHTETPPTAHSPAELDSAITRALLELSLLPGNVRAASSEPQSASAEETIPVDRNGRAKGDVSLTDLQFRAQRARSPYAKEQVLQAITEAIEDITVPRRQGWFDCGTAEGRYRAGELADRLGIRKAALSLGRPERSVYRWRAEFRASK